MNRFKTLIPKLVLVVAGVVLGLLARQVLGPPDENPRPALSIDRPISESADLEVAGDNYVPFDMPIDPIKK